MYGHEDCEYKQVLISNTYMNIFVKEKEKKK